MANKRIPDLTAYGSLDLSKARKDQIEISKNSGTFEAPVYATDGSRKLDTDVFAGIVAQINGGLFRATEKTVTVVSFDLDDDVYVPKVITPAMGGTYFRLITDSFNIAQQTSNQAYDIQFTGTFPDGFCVGLDFSCKGGSKNNINGFYFSTGKMYICVYSLANNEWYFSEQESLTSSGPTVLLNYSVGSPVVLTSTNHTYVFDNTGSFQGSITKDYYLLPSDLWTNRYVEVIIAKDLPAYATQGHRFYTDVSDDFVGESSTTLFEFPLGTKAGSSVKFKALPDNQVIIESQTILI